MAALRSRHTRILTVLVMHGTQDENIYINTPGNRVDSPGLGVPDWILPHMPPVPSSIIPINRV